MRRVRRHVQKPRLIVVLLRVDKEVVSPVLDELSRIRVNFLDGAVDVPRRIEVAELERGPLVEASGLSTLDAPLVHDLAEHPGVIAIRLQVRREPRATRELVVIGVVVLEPVVVGVAAGEERRPRGTTKGRGRESVFIAAPALDEPAPSVRHHAETSPRTLIVGDDDKDVRARRRRLSPSIWDPRHRRKQ